MNERDYDKLLDTSLDELPREVNPDRDLWPGIERAINTHTGGSNYSNRKLLSFAAMLVFMVGGAWIVSVDFTSNYSDASEVSIEMFVEDMDRGFALQKANMLAVYRGKTSLTENWQDQLRELEDARNGIRKALKRNPNNFYMIQFLQNIHQHQLELIESVHTQVNRNI